MKLSTTFLLFFTIFFRSGLWRWFWRSVLLQPAAVDEAGESEEEEAKACCLRRLQAEEPRLRIVAAQHLEEEADNGVEHGIHAERLTAGVLRRAEDEQQGEDDNIQLPLPNLCRPQRHGAIGFVGQRTLRIQQAEAAACRRAEGIAVEQVRHTANGLANEQRGRNDVAKLYPVDVVHFAVGNAGSNACKHTALHSHAALPDEGNLQQMMAVIIPIEEEHVPQPAADQSGKAAINTDIKNVLMPAAILLGEEVRCACCQKNRCAQHQAVHAHRKVTYKK